jgi:hypothetical protein
MKRAGFLRLIASSLAALVVPRSASACTEVKHGPSPAFTAKIKPGQYYALVTGYYTEQDHLGAGGVNSYRFQSQRPVKQVPELLVLRTAFLDWFLKTYQDIGGTREDAIRQVEFVVKAWRENTSCDPSTDGR